MSVRVSRRRCRAGSGEKTALPRRTFNLKLVAIADLEERASTKLCKRYKLISRKSFCIRTPLLPKTSVPARLCKAFNCVFIFHLHHCNRAKSDTKMSFLIKGLSSSGGDAQGDHQFGRSQESFRKWDEKYESSHLLHAASTYKNDLQLTNSLGLPKTESNKIQKTK